jgi:hypothetical protein
MIEPTERVWEGVKSRLWVRKIDVFRNRSNPKLYYWYWF